MRKNSTTGPGRGLWLPLLLVAGCTMGNDPDPRQVSIVLPRAGAAADDAPRIVVATLSQRENESAPAPLVESDVRQAELTQRQLVIAIGQNVAHAFDSSLEQAFRSQRTDLRGTFAGLTDRDVVDSLLVGQVEFGVMGGQLSVREQHAGLRQTGLGLELYALAVAPDSALRSLTTTQVRQIFTGQVQEWKQLGLPGGTIVPVVPAEPRLAERAARVLIPGDDFVATVTRVATDRHVADQTLQNPGAIGIVRITDRDLEPGLKLLQVEWAPPTPEAFAYGSYPYALPVQLVSSGAPAGEALRFLQFVRSDAGRELLGRTLRTR